MSNPISARLRDRKNSAILGGEMPDPLYSTAADHIDAQDATIKALTDVLEEAVRFAKDAQAALLVRVRLGEIPVTAYNLERGQRQAYIDKTCAVIAAAKEPT